VDRDHPALRGRIVRYEHRIGGVHPSPDDIAGHGTHVSGIIAAADREIGVRGMCRPKLSVYKIFSDRSVPIVNAGKSFRIFLVEPVAYYAALGDCLRRGMDVINLSLGGTGASDPHERALMLSLIAAGTVVVAAMGNTTVDRTQVSYPAAIPGVIAVGAVGPSGMIANFSRIGAHITLVAPGESIWSTLPRQPGEFGFAVAKDGAALPGPNPLQRNVRYDAWPGTSMACPQVTAAVAMLLATRGRMTPAEVQRRLKRSAEPLAAMRGKRFTPTYGAGRLNVERLLARSES
jgi:subtilisin family serine protease